MILFILIGFAGFTYVRYVGRAREVAARNQVQIFSLALNAYYLDCGFYPTAEQGLESLWEKPVLEPVPAGWSGPYLDKAIPQGPVGAVVRVRRTGAEQPAVRHPLAGGRRREGGRCGKNRDILSWE